MSDLPVEESKGSTAEMRRAFARELADPNFSLSVPSAAKKAIAALLEDVRVRDERIAEALEWAENVLAMNDTVVLRDYLLGVVPDAK